MLFCPHSGGSMKIISAIVLSIGLLCSLPVYSSTDPVEQPSESLSFKRIQELQKSLSLADCLNKFQMIFQQGEWFSEPLRSNIQSLKDSCFKIENKAVY